MVQDDLWEFLEEVRSPQPIGRGGWSPPPRFDLIRIAQNPDELDRSILETPRPIDLLVEMRRANDGRFTARDQVFVEILLSVIYEDGRGQEHVVRWKKMAGLDRDRHAIPVDIVRKILGKVTRRDVERSLQRVADAKWILPKPYIPRRRSSHKKLLYAKLREILPDVPQQALPSSQAFAPMLSGQKLSDEISYRSNEEFRRRDRLKELGIKRKPSVDRRVTIKSRPPVLRTALDSIEVKRNAIGEGDDGTVLFMKIGISSDFVVFEAAVEITTVLRRDRLVRGRRPGYVYLNLRSLAAYRSPYSAPIFRAALASSYDPLLKRRRWDESWQMTLEADELADLVGYKRQLGGWRAQLVRNVIKPWSIDESKSADLLRVQLRNEEDSPDAPFVLDVHLSLPIDLSAIGPIREYLSPKLLDIELPKDNRTWSPGIGALLKAHAISKLPSLTLLARAWMLAVDEVHNLDHDYYGDLTGRGRGRRYRGGALRKSVLENGASRAIILFALEESREPDLTRREVLDRIELEGTWSAVIADQRTRRHSFSYDDAVSRAQRERRLDIDEGLRVRAEQRERSNAIAIEEARTERRKLLENVRRWYKKLEDAALEISNATKKQTSDDNLGVAGRTAELTDSKKVAIESEITQEHLKLLDIFPDATENERAMHLMRWARARELSDWGETSDIPDPFDMGWGQDLDPETFEGDMPDE